MQKTVLPVRLARTRGWDERVDSRDELNAGRQIRAVLCGFLGKREGGFRS